MNIHEGHLCGGTLNGKGGTCIGNIRNISSFQIKSHKNTHTHKTMYIFVFVLLLLLFLAYVCQINIKFDLKIITSEFSLVYIQKMAMLGDSGGPLNCRLHKNGPWVLAGITSFGSGCSSNGYHPDVYIRISYYIKWIVKTMSQN